MTELPPLHDQSDYERLFNECKKRRVRDKARIAELEAELKRCEQLRDEYHRLAGERPDTARIAALEAVLKQTTGQREYAATQRADKAEAHASDCKRLVTACENDLEELRFKYRQAEAALARCEALRDEYHRMAMEGGADVLRSALAQRERMLRHLYAHMSRMERTYDEWIDFLKARAEEGSGVLTTA